MARTRYRHGVPLAVLAFAAGTADGLSYLGVGQVFTANMTGNIVLLGTSVSRGAVGEAAESALAFGGFVVGALGGFALAGRDPRWGRRTRVALLVELALLVLFALVWGTWAPAVVLCAGTAMGLQSALATRIGVSGISTTYVTGTLTALLGQLAELARPDASAVRRLGVIAAVGVGAATAGALLRWAEPVAPWAPVVAVLAVVVMTWGEE